MNYSDADCDRCGATYLWDDPATAKGAGVPILLTHRPDCVLRLEPNDVPECRADALYMAEQWSPSCPSGWSHHNALLEGAGNDPMARAVALTMIPVVDGLEATRLTTLAVMLPESHPQAAF